MAEHTTVARPYAKAIFGLANESKTLDEWSKTLVYLVAVAQDSRFLEAAKNPINSTKVVESSVIDILGKNATEEVKRFVSEVIKNHRLNSLPAIAALFEEYKAQAEAIIDATVESAFPLESTQIDEMTSSLTKKYGSSVRISVSLKPELIGGVRIMIGDNVIDRSVRGQLDNMATSLKN
ncbi:MAG: F0F1 ATP synthase subunit delta [Neisseriaceae bacterium]|nr:F0F1 ATP synthase subunit delta [Neisseriaceae bacterium]